jgi:hypothetical protein
MKRRRLIKQRLIKKRRAMLKVRPIDTAIRVERGTLRDACTPEDLFTIL